MKKVIVSTDIESEIEGHPISRGYQYANITMDYASLGFRVIKNNVLKNK
jgi:hypothetical protein